MKTDASRALALDRPALNRSGLNQRILTALVCCCSGLFGLAGVAHAEEAKPVDPYTPQLPIDAGNAAQKATPSGSQEVVCNDPHTIEYCYKQARDLCHGAFTSLKETDTEEKKGGKSRNRSTIALTPKNLTKKPKDPGEKRALEFSCDKTAAVPAPGLKQH